MSETRRHALKILGTVTATCAFPFASDELYGQHVVPEHAQTPVGGGPYKPSFFTAAEYALLSRLTDVLIPETDTPGAVRAGVPEYIDRVVSLNDGHQALARAGLAWLTSEAQRRFSREYAALDDSQHVELLQPLSEAVDKEVQEQQQARYRTPAGRSRLLLRGERRRASRPVLPSRSATIRGMRACQSGSSG